MKKRILFVSFLFTFSCQYVLSQGVVQNTSAVPVREQQYTSVQGSPYYNPAWTLGSITDRSDATSGDVLMRYDTYRDEIQFKRGDKVLAMDAHNVKEFHFVATDENGRQQFARFRNGFKIEGYTSLNYFQVLFDGDIKYVKKYKTNYVEDVVSNYGTNEQVKKFMKTELEFVLVGETVVKLGKNRKEIVSQFGNYENELHVFMKKNKLSLKNDEDFIQVVMEFDRLKKQKI